MATKFITNETGNTLLEKIEGVFNHRNVHFFDAPVESLGSGIPRILRPYGEDSFKFTDNFIRIIFPISVQDSNHASNHASTAHVTAHVENLVLAIVGEMNRDILQQNLGLKHRQHFIKSYLNPAIKEGYIELTIPDKPKSVLQKYRLTEKGLKLKQELENKNNK